MITALFLPNRRPLFVVGNYAVVETYHAAEVLAGLKPERRKKPRREVRAVHTWDPVTGRALMTRFEAV